MQQLDACGQANSKMHCFSLTNLQVEILKLQSCKGQVLSHTRHSSLCSTVQLTAKTQVAIAYKKEATYSALTECGHTLSIELS